MFISFEGIDKSGKTTQAKLLADFLLEKNYPVVLTKEPGGTLPGEKIKGIILKESLITPLCELFLYLADRAQHVEYGRGIPIEFIKKLNLEATGGIEPDITFLLDIEPERSFLREGKSDRIENENLRFYKRVREGYLEIAKLNPDRFIVIKADAHFLKVHQKVKSIILKEL